MIICVELLHSLIDQKTLATDSKSNQSIDAAAISQPNDDGTDFATNRGKRLYGDVDYDDNQLGDELAKRMKEDENEGTLCDVMVSDGAIIEATLNGVDDDLLDLSPSQALQFFINSELLEITWNPDDETIIVPIATVSESNHLKEDTGPPDIQSSEKGV